jgi:hypothetical protein
MGFETRKVAFLDVFPFSLEEIKNFLILDVQLFGQLVNPCGQISLLGRLVWKKTSLACVGM